MKDARGLLKSIDLLDNTLIVPLLFQVIVDYLKHSLSYERFRELQVLVQCTFNLSERKKFTFSFKSLFFEINQNWRGRLPKQKRLMSGKEK